MERALEGGVGSVLDGGVFAARARSLLFTLTKLQR